MDQRRSDVSLIEPAVGPKSIVSMVELGQIPTIAIGNDGTLYAASDYGLQAISPSGAVLWTKAYWTSRVCMAPDGTLRLYASDGSVHALTPDGSEIWAVVVPGMNNLGGTALVDKEGTTYVVVGNSAQDGNITSGVVAIEGNGTSKWKFNVTGNVDGGFAVADDGTFVFANSEYRSSSSVLHTVFPNGTLRWERQIEYSWMGSDLSIGADGTIYLMDSGLHAILPNGTEIWRYVSADSWHAPAVGLDRIITSSGDAVACLNLNGTERWRYQAPDNVEDYLLTEQGTVLFTTNTSIYGLTPGGSLGFASAIVHNTNDVGYLLYSPMVGLDGTVYVLYQDMGYGAFVATLGAALADPAAAALDWSFTIVFIVSIVLAASVAIILMLRMRKEDAEEFRSRHLLWASTGLRLSAVIIGFISMWLIWSYSSMGYSGYFVGPQFGWNAWIIGGGAVLPVIVLLLAFLLSLYTWYAAFLGLASMIALTAYFSGVYQQGLLVWEADLTRGVPFGPGFVLGWVAIILIFLSALIRFRAKDDLGQPIPLFEDDDA